MENTGKPIAVEQPDNVHRIVVIGGGAGGLSLVCRLARKFKRSQSVEIVLVDHHPTHLWKPLLHEVATGSLDGNHDAISYVSLSRKLGFRFILAKMEGIDPASKTLQLIMRFGESSSLSGARSLHYEQLVIAIGSLGNDFGIPGVVENSIMLDERVQAEHFHRRFISQLHRINNLPVESAALLSVVIVGGGATGVELAADLHNVASQLEEFGFAAFSPDKLCVTILEAGPRLLAQLPQRISDSVLAELEAIGVSVITGASVSAITSDAVLTADGRRHPADLSVWAAGIKAPHELSRCGLDTDNIGRLKTSQQLNIASHPEIFAIGDCCHCLVSDSAAENEVVPPRAQSAHQMAMLACSNIINQYRGKRLQSFSYKDYGSLVSLSEYSTLGNLMGNLMRGTLFIEGWLARMVYRMLYRRHQSAIHGYIATGLIMLGDLIHRVTHSHLKLH